MVEQKYSSKMTSINKTAPAIYKRVNVAETGKTIDMGCGRYFDLYNLPGNVVGWDKYWRDIPELLEEHYDTALCSNVLNVIAEAEVRRELLETMARIADVTYITIYTGSNDNEGRPTMADCYQLNRKAKEYLPEIQAVFSRVTYKGGLFRCEP